MTAGVAVSDGFARPRMPARPRLPVPQGLRTLQVKLGLVMLVAIVAASVLLTWRGTDATSEARIEAAEAALRFGAVSDAVTIETDVAPVLGHLQTLNRSVLLDDIFAGGGEAVERRLDRVLGVYLDVHPYQSLHFVDTNGVVVSQAVRSGAEIVGLESTATTVLTGFNDLRPALSAGPGQIGVSRVTSDEAGESHITYTMPVFGEGEASPFGMLAIAVETQSFFDDIALTSHGDGSFSIVADAAGDGRIMGHPDTSLTLAANAFATVESELGSEIASLISGSEGGTATTDDLSVAWQRIDLLDGDPGSALVAIRLQDRDTITAAAGEFRGDAYRLMALILVVTALPAVMFMRYVLIRPLQRMTARSSSVADGDLDVIPFRNRRHDEIGKLAQAFQRMLDSLVNMVDRLRGGLRSPRWCLASGDRDVHVHGRRRRPHLDEGQ